MDMTTSTTHVVIVYLWPWLSVWAAILAGAQQTTPITTRLALTTLATTSIWPLFFPLYVASLILSHRPGLAIAEPASSHPCDTTGLPPGITTTAGTDDPPAAQPAPPPLVLNDAPESSPENWQDIPAFLRRPKAAA